MVSRTSLGPGQQPLQPPVPALPSDVRSPVFGTLTFLAKTAAKMIQIWCAVILTGPLNHPNLEGWFTLPLFRPGQSSYLISRHQIAGYSPTPHHVITKSLGSWPQYKSHHVTLGESCFQMNSILVILIFTKPISFSIPQNDQKLCSRVPKHLRIPRDHNWTIDDTGGTLLNPMLKPLYKSCLLMVKPHQMYSNHLMKH